MRPEQAGPPLWWLVPRGAPWAPVVPPWQFDMQVDEGAVAHELRRREAARRAQGCAATITE